MAALGKCIHEWMTNYKQKSVKPATYDRLETSYMLMSKYYIFYEKAENLTTDKIQRYINQLAEDGYSLSTIKKQYHLISAFISYANVNGIIFRPLHKGVNLPSRSSIHSENRSVEAYTQYEQTKLYSVLSTLEKPAYAAAILMMETGMRIGEVLALSWSDIDWNRRAVRINKTVVRLGNHNKEYVQNEPKSYSSIRTVPLSARAYDLLREIQDDSWYVIHDEFGRILSYEAVRWQITQACKKANVKYRGQHVFRHTFATNCYNRGCDVKILSKLLGHADVSVTYNTYIHLFGDALEEMRKVVG